MTPTLPEEISRWAADRGLGAPNRLTASVNGPDAAVVAEVMGVLSPLIGLLRRDLHDLDRSAADVARGWSAVEPGRYVAGLAAAVRGAAAVIEAVQARLGPFLAEVNAARHQSGQAIAAVIAACDWSGYVVWDTEQGLLRTAACRTLCTELVAADQRVRAAVAALEGVFAVDPRAPIDALPVPGGFAPPRLVPPATVTAGQNHAWATADLTAPDAATRRFAVAVLRDLDAVRATGDHADLLLYEPGAFDGQGRAAISVGDVATADHVAVLTPGIANSPSSMGGTLTTSQALRAASEQAAPGERTAVVAWFGYDIPLSWPKDALFDPATVIGDSLAATDAEVARQGGALLSADMARIRGLAPESASLVAIGHSMGAVTTSQAGRFEVPVDAMVLLAAPGSGDDTRRAHEYLSTPAADVFVLSHPDDPVTRPVTDILSAVVSGPTATGPFGTDPAGTAFGAQVIDAPSNVPSVRVTGPGAFGAATRLAGIDPAQHSIDNYLAGAGLLAVAGIVTGRTARVPRKKGR